MEDTAPISPHLIGIQRLYRHPGTGAVHHVVRYPANLDALPHRHASAHTITVLEGRLLVNDREIGPGGYAHSPAGQVIRHTSAGGEPCLFLTIFDRPVTIEVVR